MAHKSLGKFLIKGQEAPGLLATSQTEPPSLDLLVEYSFNWACEVGTELGTVSGQLLGNKNVTLLDCLCTNIVPNSHIRVIPRTILYGSTFFDSIEHRVLRMTFRTNDLNLLFNDQTVFSRSTENQTTSITTHLPTWSKLFGISTSIGTVSAFREVPQSWNYDVADGVEMKTSVLCELEFDEPIDFLVALDHVFMVQVFFSIILGVPQRRTELEFATRSTKDDSQTDFKLECGGWRPDHRGHQRASVFGRLIDPSLDYNGFGKILANWLSHDNNKREARIRFFECISDGTYYDVDRVVRAANLFDLVIFEKRLVLPPALEEKRRSLKETIKNVKCQHADFSVQLNSVLGSLGRLSVYSLPQKINFQMDLLSGLYLKDLGVVMKKAVEVRNRFVHGNRSQETDYDAELVMFLTKALEFVFGVSDLVEAGWHVEQLRRVHGFHQFGVFVQDYGSNLEKLFGAKVECPDTP